MYHLRDSSTDCPAIDSVDEALSTHCESTTSTGLHINHYNQERHSTDGLSTTTEIGLRHNIHHGNMDADTLVVIEAFGNDQRIGSYVHNDRCDTNFDKVGEWLTALQDIEIGEKIDHDIGSGWTHGHAMPSMAPSHATSATEDNATSSGESHASYTRKKLVLKVSVQDDKTKNKVMRKITQIYGVESISMNMNDGIVTVTVIGDVDPVNVVGKLRKVSYAEIISVGLPKVPESGEDDPTELKAELIKACVADEEDRNRCVIC